VQRIDGNIRSDRRRRLTVFAKQGWDLNGIFAVLDRLLKSTHISCTNPRGGLDSRVGPDPTNSPFHKVRVSRISLVFREIRI
jgi:hypothetical protein